MKSLKNKLAAWKTLCFHESCQKRKQNIPSPLAELRSLLGVEVWSIIAVFRSNMLRYQRHRKIEAVFTLETGFSSRLFSSKLHVPGDDAVLVGRALISPFLLANCSRIPPLIPSKHAISLWLSCNSWFSGSSKAVASVKLMQSSLKFVFWYRSESPGNENSFQLRAIASTDGCVTSKAVKNAFLACSLQASFKEAIMNCKSFANRKGAKVDQVASLCWI